MSGLGGGAGVGGHTGHGAIISLPDPNLVHHVIAELKSHGLFDQFRKECIADVDTKPAYQNLRQRVESAVSAFLSLQTWSADLNKNQLRDKLRKHILDSNFLDQGVERIVDQVVNPKISSVFIPQVEEIVYKCLGLEKPEKPIVQEGETVPEPDLLPNDLESVSPESVKSNDNLTSKLTKRESQKRIESFDDALSVEESDVIEEKVEVKHNIDSDHSDDSNEEEFESPAFEPLEGALKEEGNSRDSHLSGISDLTSHESNNSGERKVKSEVKSELQSGDSQLSQVSGGSNVKPESLKTDFQNSFTDVKCDDSNSYPEPMIVDESADPNYKINDDNASDARQYFEESIKSDSTPRELSLFHAKKEVDVMKDTGNCASGSVASVPLQSGESKISTDGSKLFYMEMATDSNDANSVFIDSSKQDSTLKGNGKDFSFENKISSLVEKQTKLSNDNGENTESDGSKTLETPNEVTPEIKQSFNDEIIKETEDKKTNKDKLNSNGKENEKSSSRRNSRDRKDDSRHHSKSSHSRHSSRGTHSERRHSSSHDKKDSKNSESKSKDKHGRHGSNNGDSKKDGDKDRRESSSYRSSHKSSRDSKHYSEKNSSEKYSTSRQNSKDSDRNRDSSKSSKSNGKDKHSHSESKHHEKNSDESKSHQSSHKDKSSSKSNSKSSKSTSSSTDEKKNEDKKRKSSKDDYCSTSVKHNKPRRSTDRDSNDGNGGYTKGPSSNSSNASSVQCNPKPKSSPCGDSNSNGNCSGQSDSPQADTVNIIAGSYIKSEFNMFQFGSMGAIKRHSLSEKSPPAKFPDKSPAAKFPEPSPPPRFPDKSPEAKFPDKSPIAKFPNVSPSLKRKSSISNSPIETKPGERTPPRQFKASVVKIEKIPSNKFPEYSEMPNKKPVIHIDGQLKPVKVEEDALCKGNLLSGIKKPKCASNIYEAMKFMKIRKQIKKIEERNKHEAILLMEKQKNLPSNFSSAFSGIPGPELELACMNASTENSLPDHANLNGDLNLDLRENLKFFNDKCNRRLTNKIDRLQKFISKIEKGFNKKVVKSVIKTSEKNGYTNMLGNKKLSVRINKLSKKALQQSNNDDISTTKSNEVQISTGIEPTDFISETYVDSERECYDIDSSVQSQQDIMGIILGESENFDSAVVFYKQSSEPIEVPFPAKKPIRKRKDSIQKPLVESSRQLKRKRTSLSSSSNDRGEESENFIHNNNLEENNKVKCKRITRKSSSYSQTTNAINDVFPGSPESDKSIENHIGENKNNPPLHKKNKNTNIIKRLNNPNSVLRTNAKIGDNGNKKKVVKETSKAYENNISMSLRKIL